MTIRERRRAPPRLSAGELAHLLLGVCERGLTAHARGTCLGVGLARRLMISVEGGGHYRRRGADRPEIRIAVAGPSSSLRAARELREGTRHARRHDEGCVAFGAPLSELKLLAERWSEPDPAGFALDAFATAAALLAADAGHTHSGQGTSEFRREVLASTVEGRITPVAPTARALDAVTRGSRGSRGPRGAKAWTTRRGLRRSAPQPPRSQTGR